MVEDKQLEDSRAVTRATKQVMDLGLPLPGKPSEEDLEWPGNVADLASQDLAHHISWWTGWASYIRWHLARAETNETAFTEQYTITQQKLIANSTGDWKTVTEIKAHVANDPILVDCKARILGAKALRKMLAALLDGYEKKYATISREISRRDAEFEGSRRTM